MAEWNVYYDSSFYQDEAEPGAASGREIPVNKEFVWKGESWKLLSIYLFKEGPVFHICKRIELETIRAFQLKWRPIREKVQNHRMEEVSDEQLDMMMSDSPFTMDAFLRAEINDQHLEYGGSSGEGWNPAQDFDDEADHGDMLRLLKHYSLDGEAGWFFVHARTKWAKTPIENIKKIEITFEHKPVTMNGPHFSVKEEGEEIEFVRPLTGQRHILKVLSYKPGVADYSAFENQLDDQWDYPSHFFQLAYTVEPPIV